MKDKIMDDKNKKNFIEKLKTITLHVDQVISGEIPNEEIFELQINNIIVGPFRQRDLKRILRGNQKISNNIMIKNFNKDKWVPLFSHHVFQRRNVNIENRDINVKKSHKLYLFQNGLKQGPYDIIEIKEKLELKEILITDMISVDNGYSWVHLYEIKIFDRRTSQLPNSPSEKLLNDTKIFKLIDKTSEAVISLAHIGSLNQQNSNKEYTEKSSNNNTKDVNNGHSIKYITIGIASIFLIILIGINLQLHNNPSNNRTDNKEEIDHDYNNKSETIQKRPEKKKKVTRGTRRMVASSRSKVIKPREKTKSKVFHKKNSHRPNKKRMYPNNDTLDDFDDLEESPENIDNYDNNNYEREEEEEKEIEIEEEEENEEEGNNESDRLTRREERRFDDMTDNESFDDKSDSSSLENGYIE